MAASQAGRVNATGLRENLLRSAAVSAHCVGFVSFAIAQIRRGQCFSVLKKVFDACQPERSQIRQMPGMLLRRPFVRRLANKYFA